MGSVIDVSSIPIATLLDGLASSGNLLPVQASVVDYIGHCSTCARQTATEDPTWRSISSSFTSSSKLSLREKLDGYLKTAVIDDEGYMCARCATLVELCDRLEARLSEAVAFLKSTCEGTTVVKVESFCDVQFDDDSPFQDEPEPPRRRGRPRKREQNLTPNAEEVPVKKSPKGRPRKSAIASTEPKMEPEPSESPDRTPAKRRSARQVKSERAVVVEAIEEEEEEEDLGEPGQYPCHRCNKVFEYQKEVNAHLALHCNLCDFWTAKKRYLDKHIHRHLIKPEEFTYKCPHCPEKFKIKDTLEYHVNKVHLNIAPYLCDECGRGFHTKSSLRTHVEQKRKKQPKAFPCPNCDKGFLDEKKMKLHLERKCGKQRPWICEHCGSHFVDKSRLKIHVLARHLKIRNHKCDQCEMAFAVRSHLMSHIKSVHSEFRRHCPECDAQFKTITGLNDHLWQIHGKKAANVKILECPHCQKSFTTSQKLRDHVILHQGIKPYKCPLCPHACALSGNLNKHIKNAHKVDPKSVLSGASDSPSSLPMARVSTSVNNGPELDQSSHSVEPQQVAKTMEPASTEPAPVGDELKALFTDVPALIPM